MVAPPPQIIIKTMVRQEAPTDSRAGDNAVDEKLPWSSVENPVNNDVESGFHEKVPQVSAESADSDHLGEKGLGEPRPPELTLKHAVVLFSLTLLFLSAAAPLLLLLSSLCIIFGIQVLIIVSFHCGRSWWSRRRGMAWNGKHIGHCCDNSIRGSHK